MPKRRKDIPKTISVSSINDFKQKLLEGTTSLDRGQGIDGEKAFGRLRQRIKERRQKSQVS